MGNHFLERQSSASQNRADVHRRQTPPDQPRSGGGSCAEYDILIVEGGPTAGTIDWEVYDVTDNSSIETGTYTLGDAVSTISSPIITALGVTVPITGGPLPDNEITLHLNRGRQSTKYKFRITGWTLTAQADGFAYAKVASCCVVGG